MHTDISKSTLNQVATLLKRNLIDRRQAVEYCRKWNTDSTKLTQAVVFGNTIISQDPEYLWKNFPAQCEECHVKGYENPNSNPAANRNS